MDIRHISSTSEEDPDLRLYRKKKFTAPKKVSIGRAGGSIELAEPAAAGPDAAQPHRRLGGRDASKFYARRRLERDAVREKLRLKEIEPKAIEKMLAEVRAKPRRRAPCPNPITLAAKFLRDPVLRFWLGCNLCCAGMLMGVVTLFLILFYPVTFRPIFQY